MTMPKHPLARYTPDSLEGLWTDREKFWSMFRVERQLLRAQSASDTSRVPDVLDFEPLFEFERADVDVESIRTLEEQTKHETAAFVDWVERVAPDGASRWIHFAVTSSDVLDSAESLRLATWFEHMEEVHASLLDAIEVRAASDIALGTRLMGRTHGECAHPQSVASVLERWHERLDHVFDGVQSAIDDVARIVISGPIGRYSHMDPEVEREVACALGLPPFEAPSTQIIPRDRHAALIQSLARYMAIVDKIATDLRLYHNRGEIMEGFADGQKGSSSMPHKQNPILCENLCGLARQVRSAVQPALENVSLWHERDMSHSSVERFQLPQTTTLAAFATQRLTRVVEGLTIDEEQCQASIEAHDEWRVREAMMKMIEEGMSRQEAYQKAQQRALDDGE